MILVSTSILVKGVKQIFTTETGWKVTVTAQHKGSYEELEQALQHALDEVRLRINSGLRLF